MYFQEVCFGLDQSSLVLLAAKHPYGSRIMIVSSPHALIRASSFKPCVIFLSDAYNSDVHLGHGDMLIIQVWMERGQGATRFLPTYSQVPFFFLFFLVYVKNMISIDSSRFWSGCFACWLFIIYFSHFFFKTVYLRTGLLATHNSRYGNILGLGLISTR